MGDLFKIHHGQRLTKADRIAGKIPFLTAGQENQGVACCIGNNWKRYKNPITVDMFGNCFFHNGIYSGDDNIYFFVSDKISNKSKLFIANCIARQTLGKYSYGKQFRQPNADNLKALLPVKDSEIDYDFMEYFIAELEAQRIAKLEAQRIAKLSAYLTVSGFDNYELSDEEQKALQEYQTITWSSFNLENLFGKATRGKRLKSADRIAGDLPFVTAGEASEGISAYIANKVEVFNENTTTIDMFGSAKYRNYKYGADDHIAVVHTDKLPMKASIFVTSAIHKASHTGKFDYGHNFYAKDADALDIMLPVIDDKPNYLYMQTLISAIQKLVIKDVVKYSDAKIEATKIIVSNNS